MGSITFGMVFSIVWVLCYHSIKEFDYESVENQESEKETR
jgi:hypothetical protein